MSDVGPEKLPVSDEAKKPLSPWAIVGLVLAVASWVPGFYPGASGYISRTITPTLPALALAFCIAGIITGARYADRAIGTIGLIPAVVVWIGSMWPR
jgi:hypothetical protein